MAMMTVQGVKAAAAAAGKAVDETSIAFTLGFLAGKRAGSALTGRPTRRFGKTGWLVSPVGLGTWQFGGGKDGECWEGVKDDESVLALRDFLNAGGNMVDTADVYGAGHAENIVAKAIADWRRSSRAADAATRRIYVMTKSGRAHGDAANPLSDAPHGPQNYTEEALRAAVAASRRRLGVQCIDLLQLHCPPTAVLREGAVFEVLRKLVAEGLIEHWGVSVETVEEGLLAVAQRDCASVQIIFNMVRLKPAETFLAAAAAADVAVIARVPLASGLLTGKVDAAYVKGLPPTDHRVFNRAGAAFDKGETWSGLGENLEDAAFPAVAELKKLVPAGSSMAAFALQWILSHPEVSVVIPGSRTRRQVAGNIAAMALPPLGARAMDGVQKVYDAHVRSVVHSQW